MSVSRRSGKIFAIFIAKGLLPANLSLLLLLLPPHLWAQPKHGLPSSENCPMCKTWNFRMVLTQPPLAGSSCKFGPGLQQHRAPHHHPEFVIHELHLLSHLSLTSPRTPTSPRMPLPSLLMSPLRHPSSSFPRVGTGEAGAGRELDCIS